MNHLTDICEFVQAICYSLTIINPFITEGGKHFICVEDLLWRRRKILLLYRAKRKLTERNGNLLKENLYPLTERNGNLYPLKEWNGNLYPLTEQAETLMNSKLVCPHLSCFTFLYNPQTVCLLSTQFVEAEEYKRNVEMI